MKQILILAFIIFVCSFQTIVFCQQPAIRVAIYNDTGGGEPGVTNVKLSLLDDTIFFTQEVDASDIRSGILNEFDVLVQAGGSGSKQAKTLQQEGVDSIKQFVRRGGGYLGICAGAYLATVQYEWSLGILNALVVDREHWNRGTGIVEIGLTEDGKRFFRVDSQSITLQYGQGPLLTPAERNELTAYRELAVYNTEIAENGAVEGFMIGTTAIAQGEYQNGKVIAISPHPEKWENLRFMIARCVLWLANKE